MSYLTAEEPNCTGIEGSLELVIEAKTKDLGGLTVRRVLPSIKRRMVGPFIFFDHMGPAEFPPGKGIQVRPHPHIGIATITYLFEGEIMHRDSLGVTQPIQSGAVNLMTAGKGIVHSERATSDLNSTSHLHGIQSWIALPDGMEEIEPAFKHYPALDLPKVEKEGVNVCVILGDAYGQSSPVATHSSMIYLECQMQKGAEIDLPQTPKELAAYIVTGEIEIDGQNYSEGAMAVACPGRLVHIKALEESRIMVLGGDPIGQRHIWWNFVSSSKEKIETAKSDWKERRFDEVPGDTDFIPLPE